MAPIRFAIIGCGRIAHRHALQIQRFGVLAAACDIVEEKAIVFARQYGAEYFFSVHELLAAGFNFDVLVVCTPNGLHAEHSVLALNKGHHVLVEKPMALTEKDAEAMIEAARRSGKKLFIVVQNRFNPPVLAIKKALDENAFGKVSSAQLTCLWNRGTDYYQDSWRGTLALDGGTLYTQFSHFIDLLYWYFGDVKKLDAITTNRQHEQIIEFEDAGVAALEFESGIIGSIHFSVNSFAQNQEGSLTIIGEKGIAKIGGEYLNTIEYARFEDYSISVVGDNNPANDYGHYKGSMSNHDKVYENLVAHLRHGKPYYADAVDGLQTVSIIERIYASAEKI